MLFLFLTIGIRSSKFEEKIVWEFSVAKKRDKKFFESKKDIIFFAFSGFVSVSVIVK